MLSLSCRRSVIAGLLANAIIPSLAGVLAMPLPPLSDHKADRAISVAPVTDSTGGRSGRLFMRFLPVDSTSGVRRVLHRLFGDSGILVRPFSEKREGRIGSYRIGFWPHERGRKTSSAYANPDGFIEVTSANRTVRVSEHFQLGDFLTHDQASVWPKYLVLREDLVDKLELLIAELGRSGIAVRHMTVMSGFRTPQYNAGGGETGGRAQDSRHMFGDAADVFVDNDGDGRMDDLNGDGRVDYRDAQVVLAAAERVERAFPDLTGGVGVYKATASHGPFAHIDVRGRRARWGIL
jgi:hypothetical protein